MTFLLYPVAAEALPFAGFAMDALPYGIDMVGGGVNQLRFVGEDSGFEVAVVLAFHSHAGAREVGRAYVGGGTVENHYLEMHTWTELSLQFGPQAGIPVEVFAVVLAGFLCMQQPHIDTSLQQAVEDGEEWLNLAAGRAYIQVFEVGRSNPQVVPRLRAAGNHLAIVVFVSNVLQHNAAAKIQKKMETTLSSQNMILI